MDKRSNSLRSEDATAQHPLTPTTDAQHPPPPAPEVTTPQHPSSPPPCSLVDDRPVLRPEAATFHPATSQSMRVELEPQTNSCTGTCQRVLQLEKELEEAKQLIARLQSKQSTDPASRKQQRAQIRCFYCRKLGHYIRECRKRITREAVRRAQQFRATVPSATTVRSPATKSPPPPPPPPRNPSPEQRPAAAPTRPSTPPTARTKEPQSHPHPAGKALASPPKTSSAATTVITASTAANQSRGEGSKPVSPTISGPSQHGARPPALQSLQGAPPSHPLVTRPIRSTLQTEVRPPHPQRLHYAAPPRHHRSTRPHHSPFCRFCRSPGHVQTECNIMPNIAPRSDI